MSSNFYIWLLPETSYIHKCMYVSAYIDDCFQNLVGFHVENYDNIQNDAMKNVLMEQKNAFKFWRKT